MLRKWSLLACTCLSLSFAAPQAEAVPISLDTWYTFGFGSATSPLVSGAGFITGTNPSAPAVGAPGWTFTLTGSANLLVLDGFLSINQFRVFNDGFELGVTSAPTSGSDCGSDITCALSDADFSRGSFALGPGSYTITGENILGSGGAGFLIVQSVPEPMTLALFGAGLVGLGIARRRLA